MLFEKDHIYHVYNQGNNRQKIFFKKENYLFFLQKMRIHLLPYSDILAWCLMPNHFHWMFYVRETEIDTKKLALIDGVTWSHPVNCPKTYPDNNSTNKTRILNDSISILLRSYTRAINKQEQRTGNLFREATKAECVTKPIDTPSFYSTEFGAHIIIPRHETEYPQLCFEYIHLNPVKAGLVENAEDWEFSSYRDIAGLRGGKLINRDKIHECCLHL